MRKEESAKRSDLDLMDRPSVQRDYGIPVATQEVWHSTNRYGWRDLAIKVGRLVRYRRCDIEAWIDSRMASAKKDCAPAAAAAERHECAKVAE